MNRGKATKNRYGRIYRDGDRRADYEVGKGLSLEYPIFYTIVAVDYNAIKDRTSIKYDRHSDPFKKVVDITAGFQPARQSVNARRSRRYCYLMARFGRSA